MITGRPLQEGKRVRVRVQAVDLGLLKKWGEVVFREVQLWEAAFLLQNVGCPLLGPQKKLPLWVRMESGRGLWLKSRSGRVSVTLSATKTPRHVREAIWSNSKPGALGYLMFPAMN